MVQAHLSPVSWGPQLIPRVIGNLVSLQGKTPGQVFHHGASARAKAMFTERGAHLTAFASPKPLDPGGRRMPGHFVGGRLQWTQVLGKAGHLPAPFPHAGAFASAPSPEQRGIALVLHCSVPAAIHCQHSS